jgi:hypothetical protein
MKIGVSRIKFIINSLLPKRNPFERPLKAFWLINLGEVKDQRLQVPEPQASFVIACSMP